MNKSQAQDRIVKLRDLINNYRYHYHVLNESIMSEEAADSLKHELSSLEAQYPALITSDSPTQRVAGAVLPGFTQAEHRRRMLSLNDIFNREELESWITRSAKIINPKKIEFFTDIKMDGLACSLIFKDGSLERGITRGDGFVGEDITDNIRTIESIPLALREESHYSSFLKGTTEIRGEIVMYKQDFARLNQLRQELGQLLFANPRNTAAGTIRQLDPTLVASRPLHFRAYDLLRDDPGEVPTNDYAYKALAALGFSVNAMASVFMSIDEVMAFANEWENKRLKLKFNTDGLVIKINDRQLVERLGVVGKAPRGAVAYKYAAEQATTKVIDIFVSIGRTGTATPVAVLAPVVIAGSTVQMATLHNESEVHRKDIRINDSVIVHKAGDIIPEVLQSLPQLRSGKEKVFMMPELCPVCSSSLIKKNAKDAAWRCPNTACPSRAWKQIQHYAAKEALDIEGLGEKNVIALLDAGLIADAADIYELKQEQLIKLDRFGEKSASKMIAAIQKSKKPPLHRFIYALGIRHVGVQTAIDLANSFKTIDSLAVANIDDLSMIDGIGIVVAESVVEYFTEPSNRHLLGKFTTFGIVPITTMNVAGKLAQQNFVITGSLESMSRDEAAERIRNQGGTIQATVSKDTTYLIVGDSPGLSKTTKAAKMNTRTLSEEAFLALLD